MYYSNYYYYSSESVQSFIHFKSDSSVGIFERKNIFNILKVKINQLN